MTRRGISALMLVLAAEIFVRLAGITDFPVYQTDPEIKYVVAPGQHGAFLNKNEWYFNNLSMPIAADFDASRHPNVLLIGNSIVMGGNPLTQRDKLTPQLQALIGPDIAVWPAAIGGWTQVNEMAYLDRHPEVAAHADYFAWEYMAGGLSAATPWRGDAVFPTERPVFAAYYAARRFVFGRMVNLGAPSELPTTGEPDAENLARFDAHVGALAAATRRDRPGLIWFYPTAAQLAQARAGREWLPEREAIKKIAEKYHLRLVDIADDPAWTAEIYADAVHAGPKGNKILARILHAAIDADRALQEAAASTR